MIAFITAMGLPMVSMVMDKKFLRAFIVSLLFVLAFVPMFNTFTAIALTNMFEVYYTELDFGIYVSKYTLAIQVGIWLLCGAWAVQTYYQAKIEEVRKGK